MEPSPPVPPAPPPLESLFPTLRGLPRQGLRPILEGMKFRNSPGRAWMQFAPILLFFALFPLIIIPIILMSQESPQGRAQATGRIVESEIIPKKDVNGQPANMGTLFLKYQFQVAGRIVTGATLQAAPNIGTFLVGSPLEISFQTQDPTQNEPLFLWRERQASQNMSQIWPMFLLFPAFVLLMFGPMIVPPLRQWFLVRRLGEKGAVCNGAVEFVKQRFMASFNNSGPLTFEVFYRFRDDAGVERTGKMACDNAWLVNQLKPGDPLVVAFDPQKPEKNIFLEPFVA